MTILVVLIAAHFIGLAVLIARDPAHLLDAERAHRAHRADDEGSDAPRAGAL